MTLRLSCAVIAVASLSFEAGAADTPFLHAPSVDTYAKHDPRGRTILATGRYLQPVGRHLPVARFPYGLAMSRDSRTIFVASDGIGQLITNWQAAKPSVAVLDAPSIKTKGKRKERPTNTGGADFSPDGQTLYWSAGELGAVGFYDVASRREIARVSLNVEVGRHKFEDSYIVDVKASTDGKYLYCADVANFRLVVIDATRRLAIGSVPVGRYPYAVAVRGNHVYLANIGLFEYSPVPNPKSGRFDKRGLTFPPFGYPSKEARDGVEFEGRKIPAHSARRDRESFAPRIRLRRAPPCSDNQRAEK